MNMENIISKLSLEEKLLIITGKNKWNTYDIGHLGIPSITFSDGPYGLRKEIIDNSGNLVELKALCFPTSSALSATWNTEIVKRIGEALGEECRSLGVDILLGPSINIKRTPLCGRNFEYFSEDPLLTGELASAYIEGVQSKGIGTCVKHFAANNQEYDRLNISSEIDIRTLKEIYLKPFEIAIRKSNPWSIMCAYNRLNGIYCCENHFLLQNILREEWGFDGIVVSDWSAVHDRAKSLNASLDLEMPFSDNSAASLKEAYENGLISETTINSTVERLLNIVFKANHSLSSKTFECDLKKHRQLAKDAALEAITLLKNEDNILPINKNRIHKLTVLGLHAKHPAIQGNGSARIIPIEIDSPLDRIKELTKNEIEVEFIQTISSWYNGIDGLSKAMESAENTDMVIIFVGNTDGIEVEGHDRTSLKLIYEMEDLILKIASVNSKTVVVVQAGSAIDMSAWIDKVKAVVFAWFTGETGGSAQADILFGLTNPSGKTAETFPLKIEDTSAYSTYPGNGYASWYSDGIMVGYRYYDTFNKEVLFPFGHGLSYTTFQYTDLKISPLNAFEDELINVSLKIKNTGSLFGKETIQLYVRDVSCKVLRPYKELKAFKKIDLNPGEQKEIQFILGRDAFEYFNTCLNSWYIESGRFNILVGSSSRDIRLSGDVFIKAYNNYS